MPMSTITLTDVERAELSRRANSRAGRADDARRARLILLLDAGETYYLWMQKDGLNAIRGQAFVAEADT